MSTRASRLSPIISVALLALTILTLSTLSHTPTASAASYTQTAPAINNFMSQQQAQCEKEHKVFSQGRCLDPVQPMPNTTSGANKPACNAPSPTDGVPADCIPPVQISMANCRLQNSILLCFVQPSTEIGPGGVAQFAPLMPPQGLEIKEASLEGTFKPGILVLPRMCSQAGNEWECQIPSSGQRIIIRAR